MNLQKLVCNYLKSEKYTEDCKVSVIDVSGHYLQNNTTVAGMFLHSKGDFEHISLKDLMSILGTVKETQKFSRNLPKIQVSYQDLLPN